jgi:hypothetical protein
MTGAQVEYFECRTRLELPSTLKVGALYFVKGEKKIMVNHGKGDVVEYGVNNLGELDGTLTLEQGGTGVVSLEELLKLIGMPVTEQAIKDLQDSITTILGDINSLWQPYRQVPSYDFTTNVPTQNALTEYAQRFLTPTELAAGAVVTNLFDGSDWFYDPRLQRWVSYGSSGLTIANLTTIGLVKASTGKGNIAVKQDGTMRPVDCETTLTRAQYTGLVNKNPNILYSVTEGDGTFSFYLGARELKLSESSLETVDERIKKLEGTTIIHTTVELPRVIGGLAQIPKEALPAEAILQPKRLELFDDNGTRAAYLSEGSPGTYTFSTISTSSLPALEPHLLGTVPTKADLPVNIDEFISARGLATDAAVYDYIHVQRDETMGNQMVRYYIAAIDEAGVITWDYPLVVNTGEYQSKSTAAMGGKILTGSAAGGDFGTALTVANTVPDTPNDTQVMTAGAVMGAINSATPDIDTATNERLGLVKGYEGTTAGYVQVLGGTTVTAGTMQVVGWDQVDALSDVLTPNIVGALEAAQNPSSANPFQTRTAAQAPVDALASRVSALEAGGGGGGEYVATVSRKGTQINMTPVVLTSGVEVTVPDKAFYCIIVTTLATPGHVSILDSGSTEIVGLSLPIGAPRWVVETQPGRDIKVTLSGGATGKIDAYYFEAALISPTGPIPLPEPTVSRPGAAIGTSQQVTTSIVVPDKAFYAYANLDAYTTGNRAILRVNGQGLYYFKPSYPVQLVEVAPGDVLTLTGDDNTTLLPFKVQFFEADVYATGGVIPEPVPTVSRRGAMIGGGVESVNREVVTPPEAYYARLYTSVVVPRDTHISVDGTTVKTANLTTGAYYVDIETYPGAVISCGDVDFIAQFFEATVKGLAATESVLKRLEALENKNTAKKVTGHTLVSGVLGTYTLPEDGYYGIQLGAGSLTGRLRVTLNGAAMVLMDGITYYTMALPWECSEGDVLVVDTANVPVTFNILRYTFA